VKVIVLAQANDSVKRSLQYLTTLHDRRYLLALERAIRKQIRSLADHPGAGQFELELDWANAGYRRAIVKDFKIVQRIDGNVIVVNDIFYSRRDPKRMKGWICMEQGPLRETLLRL